MDKIAKHLNSFKKEELVEEVLRLEAEICRISDKLLDQKNMIEIGIHEQVLQKETTLQVTPEKSLPTTENTLYLKVTLQTMDETFYCEISMPEYYGNRIELVKNMKRTAIRDVFEKYMNKYLIENDSYPNNPK